MSYVPLSDAWDVIGDVARGTEKIAGAGADVLDYFDGDGDLNQGGGGTTEILPGGPQFDYDIGAGGGIRFGNQEQASGPNWLLIGGAVLAAGALYYVATKK